MKRLTLLVALFVVMPMVARAQFAIIASTGPVSVTTSSAATALPTTAPQANSAFVCNIGANLAYVLLGTGSGLVVTSSTGVPVISGYCLSLYARGMTYVAAISVGGATTITVALGSGSTAMRIPHGGGFTPPVSLLAKALMQFFGV